MDKYTEILEFFMENGVQLDREQMEELKAVCEGGNSNRKQILSKVISISEDEVSKIKKKYSKEECLKYAGFGIYSMHTLEELNNYNNGLDDFIGGSDTINIGSAGENEDFDSNITKKYADKSFKILDEAIDKINKRIQSYGRVDYEGSSNQSSIYFKIN